MPASPDAAPAMKPPEKAPVLNPREKVLKAFAKGGEVLRTQAKDIKTKLDGSLGGDPTKLTARERRVLADAQHVESGLRNTDVMAKKDRFSNEVKMDDTVVGTIEEGIPVEGVLAVMEERAMELQAIAEVTRTPEQKAELADLLEDYKELQANSKGFFEIPGRPDKTSELGQARINQEQYFINKDPLRAGETADAALTRRRELVLPEESADGAPAAAAEPEKSVPTLTPEEAEEIEKARKDKKDPHIVLTLIAQVRGDASFVTETQASRRAQATAYRERAETHAADSKLSPEEATYRARQDLAQANRIETAAAKLDEKINRYHEQADKRIKELKASPDPAQKAIAYDVEIHQAQANIKQLSERINATAPPANKAELEAKRTALQTQVVTLRMERTTNCPDVPDQVRALAFQLAPSTLTPEQQKQIYDNPFGFVQGSIMRVSQNPEEAPEFVHHLVSQGVVSQAQAGEVTKLLQMKEAPKTTGERAKTIAIYAGGGTFALMLMLAFGQLQQAGRGGH